MSAQQSDQNLHGQFTGQIKPVLYVADVEESAEFYRDVLGFDFKGFTNKNDGTPYYADFQAGDQKFGLHEPLGRGQESRVGMARLYFRIRDLEAHRQRLIARGQDPSDIIETEWMDMVIVRDLDGHEIVFALTDPERHSINPW